MRRLIGRRIPAVRQHDVTDCGAACLASVGQHFGLGLPVARIRQLAATDERGTTVLGLVEAAGRMGMAARAVRGTPDSLSIIPVPAIAHVVADGRINHFVVVYGTAPGRVEVMDPREGAVEWRSAETFVREWTGVLVLLAPREGFTPGNHSFSIPSRFLQLLRPQRSLVCQALVGALVYTLLGLSSAIFVQKVVDNVLVDGSRNLLNLLGVVMMTLLVAQLFIGATKDGYTLRVGQRIDGALIMGYYRHLLSLPQRFFDTMRVGEIISRVGDAVKIRAFLNDAAIDVVVNALILILSMALMVAYSWRLALFLLALFPLYAAIYWVTNRLNRRNQREVMECAAELESQLVESVSGASTIKRFAVEEMASLRTEAQLTRLLGGVYRSGRAHILSTSATDALSKLLTIVVLWIGAGFVIDRTLSPGGLMSFYALAGYLSVPVGRLVSANRAIQDALIAADRLFEIMDLEAEERSSEAPLAPPDLGDIRFDAVTFRYGARTKVFDGLDLTIRLGGMTAVVGESGCGKSTLASLLQKLHAPSEGSIFIGRRELRNVETGSLRRLVAAVPQEVHLFAGSLLQNIALGDPSPDLRRVVELGEKLGLTDFIRQLPGGFESRLGEHGVNLSGGQRQKLAIARALYRNPEILILDEATSSLDSTSEGRVRSTMDDFLRGGKTLIVIAHRLSTIASADRIVVLGGGRVVETGRHGELLQMRGRYHELWRGQITEATAA